MADSTVPPPATFPRMTQALSERQTVTSDSPGGRRGQSHQPAGSAAVVVRPLPLGASASEMAGASGSLS